MFGGLIKVLINIGERSKVAYPNLLSHIFQTTNKGYKHFKAEKTSNIGKNVNLIIFGSVFTTAAVFYISRTEVIPYTRRKHAIFISEIKEQELGILTYQQIKNQAIKDRTLVSESHMLSRKIKEIGMKIAKAAGGDYGNGKTSHMKNLKWEFSLVDKPIVNAFVMPGGKVVVYSGLLRLMNNEDEVAAVLAHEAAHVVARHSAEKLSEMGIMAIISLLMTLLFGFPLPRSFETLIITLPHSRRAETEADLIGLKLMAKACYDPEAARSMLSKLQLLEKRNVKENSIPPLLRTHPLTSERVETIEKHIPSAKEIYIDNECYKKQNILKRYLK